MGKTPLAEGSSSSTTPLESATVRALDAWIMLEQMAERVIDALDDITAPGTASAEPLALDDSLVIALKQFVDLKE